MSEAPTRPTPAALALMAANRVRSQMECYGPDYNTPDVGEAKAKEIAPHLLELCRMAVEQWYRCSPTPQPLSLTIIRMRDAVIFAAREEQDQLQRRHPPGSPGQTATGSVGGAGTPGAADLGPRAAGTERADQPGEVPADCSGHSER